jgi:ATP adenylyltransferase
LPLRHAFARVDLEAAALFQRYCALRRELGLTTEPYNLLVARGWMLLVPRSRASFEGIPVNSLGFAGGLFVRDDAEAATVERIGPMAVLRGVSFPVVEERAGTIDVVEERAGTIEKDPS